VSDASSDPPEEIPTATLAPSGETRHPLLVERPATVGDIPFGDSEASRELRDALFQSGARFDCVEHRAGVVALFFHPSSSGWIEGFHVAVGVSDFDAPERFDDRLDARNRWHPFEPDRRKRVRTIIPGGDCAQRRKSGHHHADCKPHVHASRKN